uniref:Reverse transcriptase domain-containing protein n=1 Tax=Tanacetum cinerariifolium TaxID=118510 RepID=A0A699K387_TANCI|nr:reverse transcriptase domain-containing protein [Tanacetum cinerariifolium]
MKKMDTKNSSFQPQRGACVAEKTNNGAGSIMENMVSDTNVLNHTSLGELMGTLTMNPSGDKVMDVEEGFWSNKDARTSPIRSVFNVTGGGGVIRSDYYGEDANEDANGSNKGSDFILEEIEAYLKDESISSEINHAGCDPEGDICLIEKLVNNDPFQLPSMDLKQRELAKAKYLIEESLELELKDLPSHLEYAYLKGADKLPVIIAKDLKDNEKSPFKCA